MSYFFSLYICLLMFFVSGFLSAQIKTNQVKGTSAIEFNSNNQEDKVIPNLISPNNDLINDTWEIPSKYLEGTNTEVSIFNSDGKQIYQSNNYQNDWPAPNFEFSNGANVFYYIIKPANDDAKKGTITVMR